MKIEPLYVGQIPDALKKLMQSRINFIEHVTGRTFEDKNGNEIEYKELINVVEK